MKKIFLFITAATCGLLSCRNKESVKPPQCYISSYGYGTTYGEVSFCAYNAANQLISNQIFGGAASVFKYDAKGNISKMARVENGDTIQTYNVFYDNQNNLIKIAWVGPIWSSVISFSYNSSQQLIRQDYANTGLVGYYLFKYASAFTNDYSEVDSYDAQGNFAGRFLFQYDTKPNPSVASQSLRLASILDVVDNGFPGITTNNTVQSIYDAADGSQQYVTQTIYTYNAQGYFITATTTFTPIIGTPSTTTYTATYKSCD